MGDTRAAACCPLRRAGRLVGARSLVGPQGLPGLRVVAGPCPSSIYMWAYTGENILSALPSKIFPGVISHMVSKGGIQGFSKNNDY